jgi:hypothetical protein
VTINKICKYLYFPTVLMRPHAVTYIFTGSIVEICKNYVIVTQSIFRIVFKMSYTVKNKLMKYVNIDMF